MLPSVLVISNRINIALGIIRSLGAAGIHVEYFGISTIEGRMKVTSSSKYVKKHYECLLTDKELDEEAIVSKIYDLYAGREGDWVLFPSDDYCTSLIDRYRNVLEKRFRMPYIVGGGEGSITNLMDKAIQNQMAAESGIRTPKETPIHLTEEEPLVPEDVIYPCFVKASSSLGGRKNEMGVCKNEEELQKKLLSLWQARRDRTILVQEYLNIDQEYAISGVCADQEIIIPAVVKKKRIAGYRRGITLMGELVSLEEIEEVRDAVYRFLQSLHYVGMFDLELMRVGNEIYFGEMNFRSGGPHYSYFASGVNLPLATVQAIYDGKPDEVPSIQLHKTFLNDSEAWADYQHGALNRSGLKRLYKEADILLLQNEEDPAPGKLYLHRARIAKAKLSIKSLLKK